MSLKSSHQPQRNIDAPEFEGFSFAERRCDRFSTGRAGCFRPVRDVPRGAGRFKQRFFHQKLQHRGACAFGAASYDVLLNFCRFETLSS